MVTQRTKPPGGGMALAFAVALLSGLSIRVCAQSTNIETSALHEIYGRLERPFKAAQFFKPKEARNEDLSFRLAPLILQETRESSGQPTKPFGAVTLDHDVFKVNVSRPTIYFYPDFVSLKGTLYPRMAYVWFYAEQVSNRNRVVAQGIRLTLGQEGAPIIWEVLSDPSGLQLVFVSRRLEAAASTEFGGALEGRKYAVEKAVADSPAVVVPRIIEDGPVPMGPIVYLGQSDYRVSTVICRCMPAQAKKLTSTGAYELVPWSELEALSGMLELSAKRNGKLAFWPGDDKSPGRLDQLLRWPAGSKF